MNMKVMRSKIKEYLLFILVAGIVTLFGLAMIIYVFVADTIRTEIISASSVRSNTYEVEELRSKNDPEYDPVYNKTKTTHATKYHRTVVVEVDGEQAELDLSSEFKFLLPGQGRKITIRRSYDGSYDWEHPLRNLIMGAALCLGGLTFIIFVCSPDAEEKKSSKKKNKSSQKKRKK